MREIANSEEITDVEWSTIIDSFNFDILKHSVSCSCNYNNVLLTEEIEARETYYRETGRLKDCVSGACRLQGHPSSTAKGNSSPTKLQEATVEFVFTITPLKFAGHGKWNVN